VRIRSVTLSQVVRTKPSASALSHVVDCALLLEEIVESVATGSTILLEASNLESLDTGGIHALNVLGQIAHTRGAHLHMASPTARVRQALTRSRIQLLIDGHGSTADAHER
jgi:anti-anti-sigma regulatory factor